jgi:hypothetical protein
MKVGDEKSPAFFSQNMTKKARCFLEFMMIRCIIM